ncbi:MAG TPA: ATP-dependent protease ATPase subunit HslU [Candidatus Polarisedimenticolia bacterium]|nr:ATP-dependent protease ATPase subunit HslU [Candidatus Polarisedimenticolia bacterium]
MPLPGSSVPVTAGAAASTADLTPRQIVAELDRYIVGQERAKRAVAIALRNRMRRLKLSPEMAEEVAPKNIIMIGPTGVGKTEIARRLARLTQSPFVKVEASKYTEVGYVGRDVESMIRDLAEGAVVMVRTERVAEVRDKAATIAEERLLDLLLPRSSAPRHPADLQEPPGGADAQFQRTRDKLQQQLHEGLLDDRQVEIEVRQDVFPAFRIFGAAGMEEMDVSLRESLSGLFGSRGHRRRVEVREAREVLRREEEEKLVDFEAVKREALQRVEQSGIVFLDEIDKVAGRERGSGPDVSREGVQRDLLPLVEGTSVNTKYGLVRTDHILFIASGAFHVSKPSDLIPELQGRFPIRVELASLGSNDFVRILTEPKNALIAQYRALLLTEGIELRFTDDAVRAIADLAAEVNERSENIGARRLHTIMERLLDEISFEGPDLKKKTIKIDPLYVQKQLSEIVKNQDLSRYIL